ncbi:hypothetical protein NDU88_003502 [Pleurodeles waltl]|uniref:Uncharacterized protein n=1 Tax=Pleurodeles waltl TaxID=8319 RepID=A0AAV7W2D9_PLEWA|nr:hypothetical protein NDU88_003502 [Pleurodeles waltl]
METSRRETQQKDSVEVNAVRVLAWKPAGGQKKCDASRSACVLRVKLGDVNTGKSHKMKSPRAGAVRDQNARATETPRGDRARSEVLPRGNARE